MFAYRFSKAGASIAILLFTRIFHFSVAQLSIIPIVVIGVWLGVIALMKRQYISILRGFLKREKGRQAEEDVTLEMVLEVMKKNSTVIKRMIPEFVRDLASRGDCACQHAARDAIVTRPSLIPPETTEKLSLLYGKYWS